MRFITLKPPSIVDSTQPHFNNITILPEKSMNLWQINAYIPGLGNIDLMHAVSLSEATALLDGKNNQWGNESFKQGGAFLLPFANRIRGVASSDGEILETEILGQKVRLPANWQGSLPSSEKHAIHGLLLNASFKNVVQTQDNLVSQVNASFHAGDFEGHWLSKTEVHFTITLASQSLEITINAKNVGDEPLPMGIGWHPYFIIPSGQRQQARLHLPTHHRALVNNYDEVFPTGQLETVKGSAFDFTAKEGVPLEDRYLDDCFTDIQGEAMVELIDPAANYALQLSLLSPHIKAIQVYAPPDKNFIAIEPQFNLADPFMKAWGSGVDTGMVMLSPGEFVSWQVRLALRIS